MLGLRPRSNCPSAPSCYRLFPVSSSSSPAPLPSSSQIRSEPTTQTSPLLRLPGEIRNQIYQHLLVLPEPVHIYRRSDAQGESDDGVSLHQSLVSLFLTCRQVYLEASSVFYSQNKFVLPADSSAAPHQVQANFLFRWFLDCIGPRNSAFLRHLAVPFPVDPYALIQSHLSPNKEMDSALQTLIPALQRRCPNLETLEFDVRCNNHWLRLLHPHTSTISSMFSQLDDTLRSSFPRLRHIGLCLTGPTREYTWTLYGDSTSMEMPEEEYEWLRQVIEQEHGWELKVAESELETVFGSDIESELGYTHRRRTPTGWSTLWLPKTPRDPTAALYERPETASILPDDTFSSKVRFARIWIRSPSRATQSREDLEEWLQWKETMLAQAGPGVGLHTSYCFGSRHSLVPAETSKRKLEKLASKLRSIVAF